MATYYIAPGVTGSDSNPGTSGSPWRTFAYAIGNLVAGDTLLLKNGTYSVTSNGNGLRFISLSGKNGSAGNYITIKAENERQAYLLSDGTGTLIHLVNCSYLSFEGIRGRSADKNVNPSERFFLAIGGHHISFKRNLLSHNNRYRNEGLITYDNSHYGILEENEIYHFHRNGLSFSNGCTNAVARRNYGNSRNYGDIPDGSSTVLQDSTRGDDFIVLYPGSDCIIENNISENSYGGFSIQAAGYNGVYGNNNQFLGNISLGDGYGFKHNNRVQDSTLGTPTNNYYANNVAINSTVIGFYIRTSYNTTGTNNTAMGCRLDGFTWDKESTNGVPGRTFFFDNTLSINNLRYGTQIVNQTNWLLDYINSFNNSSGNFVPATDSKRTHSMSINPNLSGAKIWIPTTSPMKGTGKNGADIGANIIYKYQDGVLTGNLLWGPSFPHGAIVAGVNDIAGSSAFDVHTRLGVMPTGAPPVSDTTPPTVSITSPSNSSTVSGTITITATASDNVGVANVQFYLDGVPLGSPQV